MTAQRRVDVSIAAAILVTAGPVTLLATTAGGRTTVAVLVIAMCVLVALRRERPLLSAVGIYALTGLQAVLIGAPLPINLLVPFALLSVTAHGPRGAGVVGLAGGYLGAFIFAILVAGRLFDGLAWFLALAVGLLVTAAWGVGLAIRARNERTAANRQRIEAVEAGRASEAELAVAAERARIAREMHDVVAHSLAVIIAQADGGRYAAQQDPAQAAKALETISGIGRDALGDIRRILGVLRTGEADGPIVQPQPTNEDIGELIQRVRDTGTPVSHAQLGDPRPLLPGMGLTLQRVCQEALTNVLKHGGPGAQISVLLSWAETEIVLQIDDDGRGAAAMGDGGGAGLVGMRERAQLFGGQLTAGPRATGGYRVRLVLPLHPGQAA